MAEHPTSDPQLGTLDWRPVLDHLDLVSDPVRAALTAETQALPVDLVRVAAIDPELADTAAFCEAYRATLDTSANCVVVAGRRGDVTTYAACLVLATDRADVNKTVRKHLDVRKISFAPMDEAVSRTGMAYGGITPIGLPSDWPILVDTRVAATAWVVIGSGVRGSKLAVPGAALTELPGAQLLDLGVRAAAG